MNIRVNGKVKKFPLSGPILLDLFRAGNELHLKVVHGFPDDAVILWQHYDRGTGMYYLTVQSETFELVKLGEEIPFAVISVTTLENPLKKKEKGTDGKTGARETEAGERAEGL